MLPAWLPPARSAGFLLLVALALGCGSESPGSPKFLDDPLAEFPRSIGEVGLYPSPDDRGSVADRAVGYEPSLPLWSNGLSKERYLVLPKGGSVDIADRAAWAFPDGTLFFKTFAEPGDGLGRAVETRVLRKGKSEWDFAVYQWNEAGTDAELLPLDVPVPVSVTIDGDTFDHEIPTKIDCQRCHESNTSIVIGFDELRLGDVLEELTKKGIFKGSVPADPDKIEGDPVVAEVTGYIHGNCAHCHNGRHGPENAFDLRHPVFLMNTINVPTEGNASADGIRVVPGKPEESILFEAFSGETDNPEVKDMPAAGVQRRDAAAVEMLRAWILSLPSSP